MKNAMLLGISIFCSGILFSQTLPVNDWTYLEIDNNREMLAPVDGPEWLRSFGIDAADINRDGYKDIVSGKYFYLNPGGLYLRI